MENKVVLVLVDGMRPDGILECGERYLQDLAAQSSASFAAKTVFPSITLPCHTSLFFGVQPQRHGVLTNEWRPFAVRLTAWATWLQGSLKKPPCFTTGNSCAI